MRQETDCSKKCLNLLICISFFRQLLRYHAFARVYYSTFLSMFIYCIARLLSLLWVAPTVVLQNFSSVFILPLFSKRFISERFVFHTSLQTHELIFGHESTTHLFSYLLIPYVTIYTSKATDFINLLCTFHFIT